MTTKPPAKPSTVTEYIARTPNYAKKQLEELNQILVTQTKTKLPTATQAIKWGQIAISDDCILIMYGAHKNHLGVYPTPAVLEALESETKQYSQGKGSVQFPLDKPLPKTILRKIINLRIKLYKKGQKWM